MTDNCFKLGVKEMRHRDSRREGLSRMADGLCKETESGVQSRRRTGQQNTLGESGLKKTFKATDTKGMTFSVLRGDVEIKKAEGGEGMSESL